MSRFRYLADPLCLLACAAYGANRWLVPLAYKGDFLRGHFNDLLLIPAALPPWLWILRRLGLRPDDAAPRWPEIALTLVLWSIAAEVVAPRLFAHATADLWDVAAYAGGALVAGAVWSRA